MEAHASHLLLQDAGKQRVCHLSSASTQHNQLLGSSATCSSTAAAACAQHFLQDDHKRVDCRQWHVDGLAAGLIHLEGHVCQLPCPHSSCAHGVCLSAASGAGIGAACGSI